MSADREDGFFDDDDTEGGRGYDEEPFTMLPNWIMYADVSPYAKAIYWALALHLNQKRVQACGDRMVKPKQGTILALSGIKSRTTFAKYRAELKEIGAVDWRTRRHPANPMRKQTVHKVHKTPPADYDGPKTYQEAQETWTK